MKNSLLIIFAGVLWGTMGLFVRLFAQMGFSSVQTAAVRVSTAALVLVLIALLSGGKKLFKIKLRDLGWFIASGVISIAGMSCCYFMSINASSMCVAAILLYTAPVIVTVFSVFLFRERFTVHKLLALISAFLGCVFVTGLGGRVTTLGVVFGICSAFCYASYSLFGKVLLKRYHPITVTVYSFLFASFFLLCICNTGEVFSLFMENGMPAFWFLAIGIVTAAAPFMLYTSGLSGMEAGKASVIASIEPLVAAVCGALVFDEKIGIGGALGMILILLAVLLVNNFGKSND